MTEPPFTRRRFVQTSGAAAAGVILTGPTATALGAVAKPSHLRRSSYAKLGGTAFTTNAQGRKLSLRLAEVTDLVRARTQPSLAGHDDAFTLVFTGPRTPLLAGTTRELRHAALGRFSVFIAPVGRATAKEQRYEVVVDRAAVT